MKRMTLLLIAAWLAAARAEAVEIKKEGWLFPNPAAAEKLKIRTLDYTPRVPGKETEVKMYRRKKDGAIFSTLEIEGEIYACQFRIAPGPDKPPEIYAIVDSDGDGVFESKYSTGEKAVPPEWVIRRYFKKHPEQSDPGPPAASVSPKK